MSMSQATDSQVREVEVAVRVVDSLKGQRRGSSTTRISDWYELKSLAKLLVLIRMALFTSRVHQG